MNDGEVMERPRSLGGLSVPANMDESMHGNVITFFTNDKLGFAIGKSEEMKIGSSNFRDLDR